MTETLAQTLTRLTKHLPVRPAGFAEGASARYYLSVPAPPIAPATNVLAAQARPARPPQPSHGKWRQGLDRAYYSLSARANTDQQAALEVVYANEITAGPGFLKVRRSATFGPVPVVVFDRAVASEIMKQARQIEVGTYASRAKGAHGGCLGRAALVVLEFMAYVQWPRSPYGMTPSIAHIAKGARLSRSTACEALKILELHGFLKITRRRKIIQTIFGPKTVQDTSGYVLQQAAGLGAMALALTNRGSESNSLPAKRDHLYKEEKAEKGCNREKKFVYDYGEYGQVQQDFGPS